MPDELGHDKGLGMTGGCHPWLGPRLSEFSAGAAATEFSAAEINIGSAAGAAASGAAAGVIVTALAVLGDGDVDGLFA